MSDLSNTKTTTAEDASAPPTTTASKPPRTSRAARLPPPVHADDETASRLCNKWVESAIDNNQSIRFLLQTLVDSGCAPPERFIRCMKCEQPCAGGFGMVTEETLPTTNTKDNATTTTAAATAAAVQSKEQCQRTMQDLKGQMEREKAGQSKLSIKPEIFLCQQYLKNESMAHKTLHHELIHAIDMCRTKMDPLYNCVHMACTEIRAENLSGECDSVWREWPRMTQFAGHGRECVRRRAILSVRANPHCTARADDFVDAAMARCFQDVYPYDKHPSQRPDLEAILEKRQAQQQQARDVDSSS